MERCDRNCSFAATRCSDSLYIVRCAHEAKTPGGPTSCLACRTPGGPETVACTSRKPGGPCKQGSALKTPGGQLGISLATNAPGGPIQEDENTPGGLRELLGGEKVPRGPHWDDNIGEGRGSNSGGASSKTPGGPAPGNGAGKMASSRWEDTGNRTPGGPELA